MKKRYQRCLACVAVSFLAVSSVLPNISLFAVTAEESGLVGKSESSEEVEVVEEEESTQDPEASEEQEVIESSEVAEEAESLETPTTDTENTAIESAMEEDLTQEETTVFSQLRDKWSDYIIGNSLGLTDPQVKQYIENLNRNAFRYWRSMNVSSDSGRTSLWNDLSITINDRVDSAETRVSSGNMAKQYGRLLTLATAYQTEGTDFYQNPTVKEEIILGIEFMNEHYYGIENDYYFGNWYDWEIAVPRDLLQINLLLYDDLSREQIATFTQSVRRFTESCEKSSAYSGSFKMTAAGLLDKAEVIALDGALSDRSDKLAYVRDAQKTVYQYVTSGDGFYEDGSYIQHGILAYTSGYGTTFFEAAGLFFYLLNDTPWEIAYEDGSEQHIYDMVFEAVEPLLYDGQFMDMTTGRGIVRPGSNVLTNGVDIIHALLPIGESMPEDLRNRFNSMVKYYISLDETYFYERSTNIVTLLMGKEIMNDSSILPRGEYVIHKTYTGMERIAHIQPAYGFGIAMSSTRQGKNEMWNSEGKRIWNIADGMTYLYTADREQYLNGYWATIDPRRLAGTTVEYVMRPDATSGEFGRTSFSWAGGSTLGNYGSAGVALQSYGSGNVVDGATSKKSWFMFDNEIVALGTAIHSDTGNLVETIVDNRQIQLDCSNKVIINGEEANIIDNSENVDKYGTTFQNVKWANIEGNVSGTDIGYYFPAENTEIQGMKEYRKDNWINQGSANVEAEGSYATLWFEHGANPDNESYQYVILPNTTPQATADYAANPNVTILANNDDSQAAKSETLGITGINFWNDKEVTVGEITSNKKASVTMKVSDEEVELSVSDPTQENTGTIELEISIPNLEVLEKDEAISVEQTESATKLTIQTANSYGKSRVIKLKREVLQEVDKTPLEEAIKHAEELIASNQYNEDAEMDAYKDLVEAAKNLLISEALTEAEVAQMVAQLEEAEKQLTLKPELNTTDLENEIKNSEEVQKDIALGKYLDKGQEAFKQALEAAKNILNSPTSQPEIDDAMSTLKAARLNLELKPDLSELETLLQKAKEQKAEDYNTASYAVLQQRIAEAQAIIDQPEAEAAQVLAALENLKAALEALVKLAPDTEEPENHEEPSGEADANTATDNDAKADITDKAESNKLSRVKLPTTGETQTTILSYLGLALLSIFGLSLRKKRVK